MVYGFLNSGFCPWRRFTYIETKFIFDFTTNVYRAIIHFIDSITITDPSHTYMEQEAYTQQWDVTG